MKPLIRSSKGQAIVLVAVTLLVLLGFAGLAVDIGMAYGVQAKLNAAVDAAAIAAGRAISRGTEAAKTQAKDYFYANFPTGVLGSTVSAPNTAPQQRRDGSWDIEVSATASVPTNFAKLIGWPVLTVRASATSTVRSLDLVLVLDSSPSLSHPSETLDQLKIAANDFLSRFDQVNDRIGLVHFSSCAVSDVTITETRGFNLTAINAAIDGITLGGSTATVEGLRKAKAQLDNVSTGSRNSLRVIVFFSDGAPNCVTGVFDGVLGVLSAYNEDPCHNGRAAVMYSIDEPNTRLGNYCSLLTLPDIGYMGVNLRSDRNPPTRALETSGGNIVNTICNANRAARNMAENVAQAARGEAESPIHIFTIGLGKFVTTQEMNCGYGSDESGKNILRRLANVQGVDTHDTSQPTGLYAYAADGTQLDDAFRQVENALLRLTR